MEIENKKLEKEVYLEMPLSSSTKPDVKIGNTKIYHIKESTFRIEMSKLILDSVHESLRYHIKNIKTFPHAQTFKQKQLKISKDMYEIIEFNADSVMPLTKFLEKAANKNGTSYNTILHFIGNIGNQVTFLLTHGYSIPFFSLEDFIVINNTIFCFMNDEKFFKIDTRTNQFTIDYPIEYNINNSFIPPHVSMGVKDKKDKIPIDLHFSTVYYSLAQICVYIFLTEHITCEKDFEKVSGPFFYTPLYWCLKRCLDKDENKRILLYV